MSLLDEVQIAKVPFHRRLDELSVIPVDDSHSICLPFAEVVWQVVTDAGPEERRDAADGRYVVLVNVVEDLLVEGKKVFEFRFAESTLRGCDVSERVRDEYPAVLALDAVQELRDAVVDRVDKNGRLPWRVGVPRADLVEYELDVQRKVALFQGLLDDGPLTVGHRPSCVLKPGPNDGTPEVLTKWGYADVVVLVVHHLAEGFHDARMIGKGGDDYLAVEGQGRWKPGQLVSTVLGGKLVEGVEEEHEWSVGSGPFQETLEVGDQRRWVGRNRFAAEVVEDADLLTDACQQWN